MTMDYPNDQAVKAAMMQRDALLTLLIAQSVNLTQQLALLAGSEKAAVARLVAIGQAIAIYARTVRPDPQVTASFDHVLSSFSPILDRRSGISQARQACLEIVGASTAALSSCLQAGKPFEWCQRESLAETDSETAALCRYLKALLATMAIPEDRLPATGHPDPR